MMRHVTFMRCRQESRRLLIAITQHITYNEYLREIFGNTKWREVNSDYGVALEVDSSSEEYANGAFFILMSQHSFFFAFYGLLETKNTYM